MGLTLVFLYDYWDNRIVDTTDWTTTNPFFKDKALLGIYLLITAILVVFLLLVYSIFKIKPGEVKTVRQGFSVLFLLFLGNFFGIFLGFYLGFGFVVAPALIPGALIIFGLGYYFGFSKPSL